MAATATTENPDCADVTITVNIRRTISRPVLTAFGASPMAFDLLVSQSIENNPLNVRLSNTLVSAQLLEQLTGLSSPSGILYDVSVSSGPAPPAQALTNSIDPLRLSLPLPYDPPLSFSPGPHTLPQHPLPILLPDPPQPGNPRSPSSHLVERAEHGDPLLSPGDTTKTKALFKDEPLESDRPRPRIRVRARDKPRTTNARAASQVAQARDVASPPESRKRTPKRKASRNIVLVSSDDDTQEDHDASYEDDANDNDDDNESPDDGEQDSLVADESESPALRSALPRAARRNRSLFNELNELADEPSTGEASTSSDDGPMHDISADDEDVPVDRKTPSQTRLRRRTKSESGPAVQTRPRRCLRNRTSYSGLDSDLGHDDDDQQYAIDSPSSQSVSGHPSPLGRRVKRRQVDRARTRSSREDHSGDNSDHSAQRSNDDDSGLDHDQNVSNPGELPRNPYMTSPGRSPGAECVRFYELQSAVRAYIHAIALTFIGYDFRDLIGRGLQPHSISEDQAIIRGAFHKVEDDHINSVLISQIASGDWGRMGLKHKARDRFDLQTQLETHPILQQNGTIAKKDHVISSARCVACSREVKTNGHLTLRQGVPGFHPRNFWNSTTVITLHEGYTLNKIHNDDLNMNSEDEELDADRNLTHESVEFHETVHFPVGSQCFERINVFHKLLHFRRWATKLIEGAISKADLNANMDVTAAIEAMDLTHVHIQVTRTLENITEQCDVIAKRAKASRQRKADRADFTNNID